MRRRPLVALLVVVTAMWAPLGCGDDPGDYDYPNQEDIVSPDIKYDEPDPFQPGESRLSVDVFYEGGRSETIYINGLRTHYFIFGGAELGKDTYSLASWGDRVEGKHSDQLTLSGTAWWGGGIVWDEPVDLSRWKKLFVDLKSSDASFARIDLTLLSGEGATPASVTLNPADYGFVNDGEWHFLEIDLQDAIARGFDLSKVRSPFIVGGSGGKRGDQLLIDNLYLTEY